MTLDRRIKILVVDDFSTMRRIIRNRLWELGFSDIDEAEDGRDALQRLNNGGYGLLITDWNMPNVTGMDLLESVRADAALKTLPVLMVTAEAKRQQIMTAAHAGVNGYIVKPFTAKTLQEKIEAIFKRITATG